MRLKVLPAAAVMLSLVPVASQAEVRRENAASLYVRARAADAAGMLDVAAKGYAAALDASPNDPVLAVRAYRQAITAGDEALARRAAIILDRAGALPPDGRLLAAVEAVRAGDWKAAGAAVDKVEGEDVFGFLVPVMRAWIAFGMGDRNAIERLADPGKGGTLAIAYAGEHRPFLLLAYGRRQEGIAATQALAATAEGRGARLRLQAAAKLSKDGDRAGALALLAGNDPALAAARARIEDGKVLPGAVDTPAAGIGQLLTRVAHDINHERATPLGLALARMATFLAPGNSETWLATAEMLANADHTDAALEALSHIPADDPAADTARLARLQLLSHKGEQEEALTEARAAASRPDASLMDVTRLGDLLAQMERNREAADAYGRALAMAEKDPSLAETRWSLLMLRGGVLDAAGDWAAAKADLEQAVKLAPGEAAALNYLGYAQLERGENLAQAEKLIERASALKPDDAAITDSLGWTYYVRGNLPKAITTLEKAVEGQPAEPTINEHLGDAYWKAGRRYEARYAWRAALVTADDKLASRIRAKIDNGLSPETGAP